METLAKIQHSLAVPKGQRNDFGGFNYRSAEDVLKAVKPLLPDGWALITSCEVVEVCGIPYQKATATLSNGEKTISAIGMAREPESKKGMDASQISGAAMSYAKKYALGNLFAIDNEKDADALAPDAPTKARATKQEPTPQKQKPAEEFDYSRLKAELNLWADAKGIDRNQAKREIWAALPEKYNQKDIDALCTKLHNDRKNGAPA